MNFKCIFFRKIYFGSEFGWVKAKARDDPEICHDGNSVYGDGEEASVLNVALQILLKVYFLFYIIIFNVLERTNKILMISYSLEQLRYMSDFIIILCNI